MPRLLVDANIFLELQLGRSNSVECKEFLSKVAKGRLSAATTDFILDSIAVVMEDRGSPPEDIRKFFASLLMFKGLLVYNLGLRGRFEAAGIMEDEKLGFDDATSVAVMRKMGVREIVSFDRDFDGVQGISRIEPKAALARA